MTTIKPNPDHDLFAREGPDLTQAQVRLILHYTPKSDTLWRWRRTGEGPPFRRIGPKHARVTYPRAAFWEWYDGFVFASEDDAAAAGC